MAIFGNTLETDLGGHDLSVYGLGSQYTCPESGIVDKITARIWIDAAVTVNIKSAMYDSSGNLITNGLSDEVGCLGIAVNKWYDFPFSAPKPSLLNQDYIIVLRGAATSYLAHSSVETGSLKYSTTPYASFPADPETFSIGDAYKAIYCTYTPSGQVYISKVQRVTGMRTFGGISSIYNRFPTLKPRRF